MVRQNLIRRPAFTIIIESGRRRPLTIKFPGYVYIRVVYCQEWRKTLDIDDQRGDGGALVGLIRPCVKMADRTGMCNKMAHHASRA